MLRSLAATPERAAEIDMNEGVLDVIELKFPPKGTLVTPSFGKATGLRFFPLLRSLGIFAALLAKATGGRMPADHETIRIWGLHGGRIGHDFFLFREVLGGGGPGRPWADGSDVVHVVPNSRNLPAEFSETRYPVIVERLGLAKDSGGAGCRRGGFGYDKRVRALEDCEALSNADRAMINTYGVNGGKYGGTYSLEIDKPDGTQRKLAGMEDRVPRRRRLDHQDPHDGRRRLGRPLGAGTRDGLLRRAVRPGFGAGGARRLWSRARARGPALHGGPSGD